MTNEMKVYHVRITERESFHKFASKENLEQDLNEYNYISHSEIVITRGNAKQVLKLIPLAISKMKELQVNDNLKPCINYLEFQKSLWSFFLKYVKDDKLRMVNLIYTTESTDPDGNVIVNTTSVAVDFENIFNISLGVLGISSFKQIEDATIPESISETASYIDSFEPFGGNRSSHPTVDILIQYCIDSGFGDHGYKLMKLRSSKQLDSYYTVPAISMKIIEGKYLVIQYGNHPIVIDKEFKMYFLKENNKVVPYSNIEIDEYVKATRYYQRYDLMQKRRYYADTTTLVVMEDKMLSFKNALIKATERIGISFYASTYNGGVKTISSVQGILHHMANLHTSKKNDFKYGELREVGFNEASQKGVIFEEKDSKKYLRFFISKQSKTLGNHHEESCRLVFHENGKVEVFKQFRGKWTLKRNAKQALLKMRCVSSEKIDANLFDGEIQRKIEKINKAGFSKQKYPIMLFKALFDDGFEHLLTVYSVDDMTMLFKKPITTKAFVIQQFGHYKENASSFYELINVKRDEHRELMKYNYLYNKSLCYARTYLSNSVQKFASLHPAYVFNIEKTMGNKKVDELLKSLVNYEYKDHVKIVELLYLAGMKAYKFCNTNMSYINEDVPDLSINLPLFFRQSSLNNDLEEVGLSLENAKIYFATKILLMGDINYDDASKVGELLRLQKSIFEDIKNMVSSIKENFEGFDVKSIQKLQEFKVLAAKLKNRKIFELELFQENHESFSNHYRDQLQIAVSAISDCIKNTINTDKTVEEIGFMIDPSSDKLEQRSYQKIYEELSDSFKFSDDNFEIVLPSSSEDFIKESSVLSHCVSSYYSSVARGKDVILFIRRKEAMEVPFYTIRLKVQDDNIFSNHRYSYAEMASYKNTAPEIDTLYGEKVIDFTKKFLEEKNIKLPQVFGNKFGPKQEKELKTFHEKQLSLQKEA